jgi:hypothetical protein
MSTAIFIDSPLITKPPVPVAMADKLITALSCLPKMTYDLPADDQPLSLVQVQMALLSMASQRVIIVPTQSPAQAMSTAMV